MIVPLVLHTCDAYSNWWPIWYFFYKKYIKGVQKLYFITEEMEPLFSSSEITVIKTGKGEWGSRLIRALNLIPETYIFYSQEDYWAKKEINLLEYHQFISMYNIDAMRITKMLTGMGFKYGKLDSDIYKYDNKSSYLMNHRFSLWNRLFFLKYIKPSDTPWANEKEQTKKMSNDIVNIYHINDDWYDPCVTRGHLRDYGKELLIKHYDEYLLFYSSDISNIKDNYKKLCSGDITTLTHSSL